jgi:hypothetical protein
MAPQTCVRRLSTVQDEIEVLLAHRPVDDFSPPRGYLSLVALEADLLERVKHERSQNMVDERATESESYLWPTAEV